MCGGVGMNFCLGRRSFGLQLPPPPLLLAAAGAAGAAAVHLLPLPQLYHDYVLPLSVAAATAFLKSIRVLGWLHWS